MTNEQLAILLRSHHSQLASIFNRLLIELKDIEGLEYHLEWGEWMDDLSAYIDNLEQSVKDLMEGE